MKISFWDTSLIQLKRIIAFIFLPVPCLLLLPYFMAKRYKIRHLSALRSQFASIMQSREKSPMLVVLNHLTRIDSLILTWALLSPWQHFTKYAWVMWHVLDPVNLPLLCPILKVIPIERKALKNKTQKTLGKIGYVLSKGDLVVIFPEGTRSTTGRLNMEDFQYGVGEILKELPKSKVLCVYLRGDKQTVSSGVPAIGSTFDVSMQVTQPVTAQTGMRASRDLSLQIMATLHSMEEDYFQTHRDQKS